MDCPSASLSHLHFDYPHRLQRPPLSTQPLMEYYPQYSGHEATFDVQVRVQRSFSFEELQSGSYFASLDESDLQFYRVYGQPVLIPSSDEVDSNYMVHGSYPSADLSLQNSGLHIDHPAAFTSKSYTLQNPLGEGLTGRYHCIPSAPQLAAPSHDWQLVKQEPIEGLTTYATPSLPAISCQLYTLPDQDDDNLSVASPSESSMQYVDEHKPKIVYDEPPMDSLPYPPPVATASPPFFQPPPPSQATQDVVTLSSTSFIQDTSFQVNTSRDQWEDSPAFSATFSRSLSSATRSHRRQSRSPPPQSPSRMSPVPHGKRSLDKKPALACLFCRGRKIACGPPQPDSKDKTCNQCARRHLKCEYPLESRRGMRKRRSLIPRISSTTPEINTDGPRANKTSRKRTVDKSS